MTVIDFQFVDFPFVYKVHPLLKSNVHLDLSMSYMKLVVCCFYISSSVSLFGRDAYLTICYFRSGNDFRCYSHEFYFALVVFSVTRVHVKMAACHECNNKSYIKPGGLKPGTSNCGCFPHLLELKWVRIMTPSFYTVVCFSWSLTAW